MAQETDFGLGESKRDHYRDYKNNNRKILKDVLDRKSSAQRLRELKEERESKPLIAKRMINKLINDPELMGEFNKQMRAHKINKINNEK